MLSFHSRFHLIIFRGRKKVDAYLKLVHIIKSKKSGKFMLSSNEEKKTRHHNTKKVTYSFNDS